MKTEQKDRVMEGKEYRQQMMDKLSIETSEADTWRPVDGNKDLYVRKLETKVERLKSMIDDMVAKSKSLESNIRKEFQEDEKLLAKRYRQAKLRLDEVRESSGDAWKELHDNSFHAWQDLAHGVKKAISRFK